jgi:small GTP-binding protein
VAVFGDIGVGTSNLLKSTTSEYIYDTTSSIGVDFWVKKKIKGADLREKVLQVEGKTVKLVIWRLSGEKRFRYLIPSNIKGSNGGIFVYNVANYSSINHIDDWLKLIKKKIDDLFPIIVVGNHATSKDREVSREEGIQIAKSRGLDAFIECDSKTGENVEEMFEALTRLMLQMSEFY